MGFYYYDNTNTKRSLDLQIGSRWSEVQTGNSTLNSIFAKVDNGDGIVSASEIEILTALLKKADNFIKSMANNNTLENNELQELANYLEQDNNIVNNMRKQVFTSDSIPDVVAAKFEGDTIEAYGITHYKYKDCNPADLVDTGTGIKVHKKCLKAFKEMEAAAAKEGLNLNIVSGFRSEKYQVAVFKRKFTNKVSPSEEEFEARLKFSAPSGFSEHHTGLAIDINETEECFANTKEYAWLLEHAREYGFEMSFPKDGSQGLGFEPWHWRYVGDENSQEIFKAARENV